MWVLASNALEDLQDIQSKLAFGPKIALQLSGDPLAHRDWALPLRITLRDGRTRLTILAQRNIVHRSIVKVNHTVSGLPIVLE